METDTEGMLQDEIVEGVSATPDGGDVQTEPVGDKPKEEVSEPQFDPTQYVPREQFAKMQSSLQRNETEARKEAASLRQRTAKIGELSLAASESRRRLDPLSDEWRQDTPEEKAYKDYLGGITREDQEADRQYQTTQNSQQILTTLWNRLTQAGIDPNSKEVVASVGAMFGQGDFEGAKLEVATLIAEKRMSDRLSKKAESDRNDRRERAKAEGQTVVDGAGPRSASEDVSAIRNRFVTNPSDRVNTEKYFQLMREGRLRKK